MSDFMTGAEIAKILGVTKNSPLNWERRGLFPKSVKIGGARRWRREAVDKFIREMEAGDAESN